MTTTIRRGFKFLNPEGKTVWKDIVTQYPLPAKGEKWGPWFQHPDPAKPGWTACGPGRWHVMKCIDARHAPEDWRLWFAECRNIVGEDEEKLGATEVRLREVRPEVFWRMIRLGWCANADLHGADLTRANLTGVDLTWANLTRANLTWADLFGANLSRADLSGADLSGANLTDADLVGAILPEGISL